MNSDQLSDQACGCTGKTQVVCGMRSTRSDACARACANSSAGATDNATRKQSGFTLIELLVAMMIFAVLGGAAYQGLFQVQRVHDGVKSQSEQLARLQRAFFWMSDDIAQVVDRPVRSTLGSAVASFEASEAGLYLLEFTRAGWENPAADVLPPRSSMQRVAYSLDGDRLLRNYWYHLDQVDEDVSKRRLLLDKVNSVSLRFLQSSGEWNDTWPPLTSEPDQADLLPAAVEFTIELEEFGQIIRLFALPG